MELVLLLTAFLGGLALHNSTFYPVDDAYITYRYSANWAAGEGLTFNPGERVEGYSNFSLVAWCAALAKVGITPPLAARVISLASVSALLLLIVYWRRRRGDTAARIACGLCLGMGCHTLFNVLSGLESPLFSALLTGVAVALTENRIRTASALGFLLALTRPEGFFAAAGLLTVWGLASSFRLPKGSIERLIRGPGLWFALPFGVYSILRVGYFGELVPNSMLAKMGHPLKQVVSASFGYTAAAVDLLYPAILALLVMVFLLGLRALKDYAYLWLGILGIVVFSLVAGSGDPYREHLRYLFPAIVLTWVLLAVCWSQLQGRARAGRPGLELLKMVVVFAIVAWQLVLLSKPINKYLKVHDQEITTAARFTSGLRSFFSNDQGPHPDDKKSFFFGHFEMASWLQSNNEGSALFVNDAVGIAPYYNPELKVLDTFGLVTPRIARAEGRPGAKGKSDWIYDAEPDYIAFKKRIPRWRGKAGQRSRALVAGGTPMMVGLFHDRRLRTHYDFVRFFGNWTRRYLLFKRRDQPLYERPIDLFRSPASLISCDQRTPIKLDARKAQDFISWSPSKQYFGPHEEDRFFNEALPALEGVAEDFAAAEVMRNWLSRRRKTIILAPSQCDCQPCGIAVESPVPRSATLRFGFRLQDPIKQCRGKVTYELRVRGAEPEAPADAAEALYWRSDLTTGDVELDLSRFADSLIHVELTGRSSVGELGPNQCLGWWTDPMIVVPGGAKAGI